MRAQRTTKPLTRTENAQENLKLDIFEDADSLESGRLVWKVFSFIEYIINICFILLQYYHFFY